MQHPCQTIKNTDYYNCSNSDWLPKRHLKLVRLVFKVLAFSRLDVELFGNISPKLY